MCLLGGMELARMQGQQAMSQVWLSMCLIEDVLTNVLHRNVTRYSYFGAFRSDVSNVGPNVAMLTEKGQLTDIGSWYLGGVATNNIPHKGAAAHLSAMSYVWSLLVVAIVALMF